jgi:hypothetical protein
MIKKTINSQSNLKAFSALMVIASHRLLIEWDLCNLLIKFESKPIMRLNAMSFFIKHIY